MKHGLNTDNLSPIKKGLSSESITREIIGAAFEVYNVLGYVFLERVYQKSMQVELQLQGLEADLEPQIKVSFKGVIVGDYAADLLVARKVIVELKVDPEYNTAHEAQMLNELKGGEVKIGLLVNFGRTKVEFKRFVF